MCIYSWAIESKLQKPWRFSPKYLSVDQNKDSLLRNHTIITSKKITNDSIIFNIQLIFCFCRSFKPVFQTRSQPGFTCYICYCVLFNLLIWFGLPTTLPFFFFQMILPFEEGSPVVCRMTYILNLTCYFFGVSFNFVVSSLYFLWTRNSSSRLAPPSRALWRWEPSLYRCCLIQLPLLYVVLST